MLTRTIDHYHRETKETIVSACRLFGVNRQVYYRHKKTVQAKQERAYKAISLVQAVRAQTPRIGTRKLYYLLEEELNELGVGRDRFHKHKNLITGIVPHKPEQIWVSDITYIGNRGNHRYLALVIDAYSKKIVGYDLSSNLSAEGAIRALMMGIKQRSYTNNTLIHHSDRGLQYCCDDYQDILTRKKIKCSMTESYDPYANAVAERINGILKLEFQLENYNVKLPVMKQLVENSIQIYNTMRPHYSCYTN